MLENAWILFALLSGLFMAVVALIDKFVLVRWTRNPMVPVILLGIISLFPALVILAITGLPDLSISQYLLVFAAGTALFFMVFLYFLAVQLEEISRVVPLLYIAPLFVAVLAVIFLGETFPLRKYGGVLAIMGGAVLISLRLPLRLRLGKAFWLMILSAFSISIQLVITKYLLRHADYWEVFALTRSSMFVPMIPVLLAHFPDLRSTVREHGWKVVWVMVIDQHIALAASLFITIAAATGYITLVNALSSVQPFFVLLFTVLISLFFPQILKEETGRAVIGLKVLAIGLMFLGVLLVT